MDKSTVEETKLEQPVLEKATFGAGCFWGVEAAFRQIKGVVSTSVGYSGGNYLNPSYHDVCTGRTGHAEVVQVVYDPTRISYDDLLNNTTLQTENTGPLAYRYQLS